VTGTLTAAPADLETWFAAYRLYTEHAALLDEQRLDEWLELFDEDCLYRVVSRENEERGLALALMRCEGRPGLRDRVHAIQEVSVYAPRTMRHLVSGLRVTAGAEPGTWQATASFAVLQSLEAEHTTVFAAGSYADVLLRRGDSLVFAAKTAVYDGSLVLNSMVYPL
jgi:3-phenylpropionate/cinnamic acid dioxygenase small subunit